MICLTGPKNKVEKKAGKKQREQTTLTFLVPPEPLINVQPFEIAKDSWETHRIGRKKKKEEAHSLFIVYCTLYIIHHVQLLLPFPDIWCFFVLHGPVAVQHKLVDHKTDCLSTGDSAAVYCMDYECSRLLYHVWLQMCFSWDLVQSGDKSDNNAITIASALRFIILSLLNIVYDI